MTDRIRRDRATPDTKGKIDSWTKWVADSSEPFEIHYDRTVSFWVIEGREEITFADGTVLDVQKDDFVTVRPGIRGIWTVIEPITNLLCTMTPDRLLETLACSRVVSTLQAFPLSSAPESGTCLSERAGSFIPVFLTGRTCRQTSKGVAI